jgi:acetyltransferase-like isoleucine patch superfamily enzyme
MLFDKLTKRLAIKLGVLLYEVNQAVARETLPSFANSPKNLKIDLPRRIINPDRMVLGDNIWLGPGSFLNAITSYPTVSMQHPNKKQPVQEFNPRIIIGNRVTATAGLQVAAHAEIIIEDDVLFASNINLTDGLHGYQQANEAYKYQPIFKIAPILIKQGCWIGQNVVILPGVTIGAFSIIGANSVVTKSIPDRCIAIGAPARVIKSWDPATNHWVSAGDGEVEDDESLREMIAMAAQSAAVRDSR